MFVIIVGHAIFHTAGRSGPSTIDRSYRLRDVAGAAADPGTAAVSTAGVAAGVDIP
jgi:hypothetical protein